MVNHKHRHRVADGIFVAMIVALTSWQTGLWIARSAHGSQASLLNRTDLIYGSEIGAWDMDGGTALNTPAAKQAITAAHVSVIRWGIWKKFDYLAQGQTQSMTLSEFNTTIDGIRSTGAAPFIKLPPVWDQQCASAPDYWNLAWLKEIIKQAGNRVSLYEFGNESDQYCSWTAADYATYWNQTVPQLKQYARSLGLQIYIGGPARSTNYTYSTQYITDFLTAVKTAYQSNGNNADYIPDFVSSHTYPNSTEDPTNADILNRITYWGGVYDQLRASVNAVWAGLKDANGRDIGPNIKLADSEYNYTIDTNDPRSTDPVFMTQYVDAMMAMFRAHGIWLACQFTLASHGGAALDMLTSAGAAKPMFTAFSAQSVAGWQATQSAAATATPVPTSAAAAHAGAATPTPLPTLAPAAGETVAPTPTAAPTRLSGSAPSPAAGGAGVVVSSRLVAGVRYWGLAGGIVVLGLGGFGLGGYCVWRLVRLKRRQA